MAISVDALLFVAGIGIIQAFLLASILYFHPRGEKSVNGFLALYIICLSMPMFAPLALHVFSWHLVSFIEPLVLLIGPLLYLYVRSFKEPITWRKAWPHLILYVLATGGGTYMYFDVMQKYPDSTYPPPEVIYGPIMMIRSAVRISQLVLYFFLARRALNAYQRSIEHLYSETSRINLAWVQWLINGYLILVCVLIIIFVLIMNFPEHFGLFLLMNTAIVSPYIYIITYKGLTQPTVWQLHPELAKEKVQEELHEAEEIVEISSGSITPKSAKSAISKEKIDEVVNRTVRLMEQEKLYQETELNLQQLADKLESPSYLVSQALNEGMKKSFYDLVNGYRVEEAKRLLLDPKNQNYKILSVGFEAGFNSKTTFNTVFKKFTGCSPTDYRERHLENHN